MKLDSDNILDRIRLKSQMKKWRVAAIMLGVLLLFVIVAKSSSSIDGIGGSYIARITVDGIIDEDNYRHKVLEDLAENNRVKAVIVNVNSPGGTLVGGETFYNDLREISKRKPVIAVMGTLATSAAYMVSIAADRIIAHKGTLTGSIGVLLQTGEITELAKKLGVEVEVIKSAPLKGSPSLLEKMTPEVRQSMQTLIDDSQNFFVGLIKERRNMSEEQVRELADGRVYTGMQAYDYKLVDELGSEREAVKWLENVKKVKKSLEIKDVKLYRERDSLEELIFGLTGKNGILPKSIFLHGLLSIWQDGINN